MENDRRNHGEECSPQDKRSLVAILSDIRETQRAFERRLDTKDVLDKKVEAILDKQEEVHEAVTADVTDTKAVVSEINEILQKYLPMWKAYACAQKARSSLREAVAEKLWVSAALSAFAFVGWSIWYFVTYLIAHATPPS